MKEDLFPTLAIVIVNWNSGQKLFRCLQSIASAHKVGFDLVGVHVVDNASADKSLNGIERLPLPLSVIRNKQNLGFSAACNQGARNSHSDYILFLNPDTSLLHNSLVTPVLFMEQPENHHIGICGIQLVNENNQVQRTCANFPTTSMLFSHILGLSTIFPAFFPKQRMTKWNHECSRPVDQVMGAYFLVRRSLYDHLDGFDERFFVYFEEVDFSFRAKLLGWGSYYLADAQAYHNGAGTTEQAKAARLSYSLDSRIKYVFKHFSYPVAVALTFATLFIEPWSRLVLAASSHAGQSAKETLVAYRELFGKLLRG